MTRAARPPGRVLEWAGCVNVRDLGGQPLAAGGSTAFGVVVRADNVRNLTADGVRAFAASGVSRVVDLRWPEELDEDPVLELPAEIVHVSLFGPHRSETRFERFSRIAAEAEDEAAFVRRLYGEYLEEFPTTLAAAAEAVASASGPALFHCTAGKDRTGLLAALILRLSGVPIEAVAAEYALTDASGLMRRGLVDGMAEEELRARRFLFSAPHAGMVGVLADLDERYGSAADYLHRAGLDADAAAALVRRLAPETT